LIPDKDGSRQGEQLRSKQMIHGFLRLLVFGSMLIVFLAACASQNDLTYLHSQINSVNRQTKKDLDDFRKALDKLEAQYLENQAEQQELERGVVGSLKEDQESLRRSFAQLQADLAEIRAGIQTLTGRVEETGHVLQTTVEKDTTAQDALVSQVKQLSSMVKGLSARIESMEGERAPVKVAQVQEPQAEKARPKSDVLQNESALYEKTLEHYWDGRYGEAIAGFKKFLTLYPTSDLADNAYFWIGECHRASEEYEEAILAYQKVINDYPKGNKVPSAMLHQALAFERIDDKTTAQLVYKKLVKEYPQSKEAGIAKKRLQ
jgi:tol-pal system protein YbgF